MTSVEFRRDLLHMDVLCVKRFLKYTLAGIGNNLFIYSDQGLLLTEAIFVDERIHSIVTKNDLVLVKGGRQLCLLKLIEASGVLECQIISKVQSSDWIQVVVMFENQLAGLVTAHNFFEYWDLKKKKQLSASSCEEKCILYSCNVSGESEEHLVVFAGTVFGDVLIWSPFSKSNSILQTLRAHNGAIFSVEVKPKEKLLATTSDDRSLKIWSVNSQHPLLCPFDWKNSTIQLIHALFGHTARVWRSLILPDCYLTIGEDSQLIVWNRNGDVMKSCCFHQESGIRGLDYSEDGDVVTTSGEDGGINAFSLKYLLAGNDSLKKLKLDQSTSTKVRFTKTGVVYTLNGSCVLVSNTGEEEVYKSENFSSYCLLEVSFDSDYIILGSIKGDLVIIDANTKTVVTDKRITDGRIYSVHSLGEFLLTCGPEGRLDLWRFSKGDLEKFAEFTLPKCKDRWTTCAALTSDALIVGDRMGNLHRYPLLLAFMESSVKNLRKIHSYLGVTDVKFFGPKLSSIGRDGTLKKYDIDFTHFSTHRLPMEWPWKMLEYKDDILILGFHGVSFIVWSMKNREVIASHECGGGHRSCDYKLDNNKLSFLYVKQKQVFIVDLLLEGITRIRSGFHGKEINCLKILQTNPTTIVTGSEDTTFRISEVKKSELKLIEVFKTHVSSVRAIGTGKMCDRHLIASVGGRGQIILWELGKSSYLRELVNHRLYKENQNWKSPTAVDPETRIMCVDILPLPNIFLIAAGCSDCHVRIFSYFHSLKLILAIPFSHCVLNVTFLLDVGGTILVSTGTDGRVSFCDISDLNCVKHLGVFTLHQSGINSFQVEKIGYGKFVLVTGGDDNMISMACFSISKNKVDLRKVWETRTAHSCQITGIKIMRNFLLTTSIDQRITVWEWRQEEDEFHVEFVNQILTAVPDVQGMDAVWLNDSTILVAVHGKGVEILKVEINTLKKTKSVNSDKDINL